MENKEKEFGFQSTKLISVVVLLVSVVISAYAYGITQDLIFIIPVITSSIILLKWYYRFLDKPIISIENNAIPLNDKIY